MNITKLEVDHMPKEVATEMLCSPKARLTNRERKECMRARAAVYVPTDTKKPYDEKLLRKAKQSSWAQLIRIVVRCSLRRSMAQNRWLKLSNKLAKLETTPLNKTVREAADFVIRRDMAALDVLVAQLEMKIDAAKKEVDYRKSK